MCIPFSALTRFWQQSEMFSCFICNNKEIVQMFTSCQTEFIWSRKLNSSGCSFWPGDFPDAISRGHELWLNVWQMPDHSNQMSGKSSSGLVTAADLTDGNTLFSVGPCGIFHSDNCQGQNWAIWPRLSIFSLLWHHWVTNGTCEQRTGMLEGQIEDRLISRMTWISDSSCLYTKDSKLRTLLQCIKVCLIWHFKPSCPKLSVCPGLCGHSEDSQPLGRDSSALRCYKLGSVCLMSAEWQQSNTSDWNQVLHL